MAATRTFSILKPDATRRNLTGAVTSMLEDGGLRVVASRRIHMTREQAEGFYAVHRERPFFGELVDFMISEPVVVESRIGCRASSGPPAMPCGRKLAEPWSHSSRSSLPINASSLATNSSRASWAMSLAARLATTSSSGDPPS